MPEKGKTKKFWEFIRVKEPLDDAMDMDINNVMKNITEEARKEIRGTQPKDAKPKVKPRTDAPSDQKRKPQASAQAEKDEAIEESRPFRYFVHLATKGPEKAKFEFYNVGLKLLYYFLAVNNKYVLKKVGIDQEQILIILEDIFKINPALTQMVIGRDFGKNYNKRGTLSKFLFYDVLQLNDRSEEKKIEDAFKILLNRLHKYQNATNPFFHFDGIDRIRNLFQVLADPQKGYIGNKTKQMNAACQQFGGDEFNEAPLIDFLEGVNFHEGALPLETFTQNKDVRQLMECLDCVGALDLSEMMNELKALPENNPVRQALISNKDFGSVLSEMLNALKSSTSPADAIKTVIYFLKQNPDVIDGLKLGEKNLMNGLDIFYEKLSSVYES